MDAGYSGSSDINAAGGWLSFADSLLDAVGAAKKKDQPGYSGLWSYTVPNAKPFVRILLEYARSQRLTLAVNGEPVGWVRLGSWQPRQITGGMEIATEYRLFDSAPETRRDFVQYTSKRQELLCTGKPVDLGAAVVTLGSVLPKIESTPSGCRLSWDQSPEIALGERGLFGFIRRLTRTKIERIEITETGGEFVCQGLGRWALPSLKWG
jgi:hypothetical protein